MNCGWDNLSDTTVCLKCGQLLSISTGYANNQNDFVSGEGYGEAIPKPTVLIEKSAEKLLYSPL